MSVSFNITGIPLGTLAPSGGVQTFLMVNGVKISSISFWMNRDGMTSLRATLNNTSNLLQPFANFMSLYLVTTLSCTNMYTKHHPTPPMSALPAEPDETLQELETLHSVLKSQNDPDPKLTTFLEEGCECKWNGRKPC